MPSKEIDFYAHIETGIYSQLHALAIIATSNAEKFNQDQINRY